MVLPQEGKRQGASRIGGDLEMNRDELLELLDIEHGGEFEYFENFADLVEHEGMLDEDVLYELLEEVDMKTFAELCESYFYDTLENVPGDQIDVFNLMENIKRVLIGLSEAVRNDENNALLKLSDELNRFRVWYSADGNAECRNLRTGEITWIPVRDAIANARLEKLSGDEFSYDFTKALEYELEECIMTYADLADGE